ncbi:unnamed protein product (plasmid) [Mycetohabitans rhizoxinica HKI 454]|uniref:Uncharacterized protein n=1 Tax=Mycetohabitans rhizoxinica (strain DSM 19002 / CIP 109453 / HKI 454) TaxID=882378 RepID=E5AU22_MYCRK|nr:unnamed protein product [Mycetohabitans rhizoxinica HKI 454]
MLCAHRRAHGSRVSNCKFDVDGVTSTQWMPIERVASRPLSVTITQIRGLQFLYFVKLIKININQ